MSYYKCHFLLKYSSIQQVVTTIGISVLFSIKMDTLFFVMAEKKSRCHITNAQNLCNMTPRAQIFDLLKKILLSNYIYPQNIRRNEDALSLHFHVSKSSLLFISHPNIIYICIIYIIRYCYRLSAIWKNIARCESAKRGPEGPSRVQYFSRLHETSNSIDYIIFCSK